MKRVLVFLGRRITPRVYLGAHLTLGLLISLEALTLFAIVARQVVGAGRLTNFDREVAVHMAQHASDHPIILHVCRFATHLGGPAAMAFLALVGGLVLLIRGRRFLPAVWFAAALGGGLLNMGLKATFDRPRPPPALRDAAVTETNESFPSGHSMGSTIGYGMLGYVLVLRLRHRLDCVAVAVGLTLLVLLIGFSRIYLRAHWFSDVCGGFAIGTVWLSFCISGLEIVRRRRQNRQERAAASPFGAAGSLP